MRGRSQSPTSRRLMVYLSGAAIGLVMLGLFNARRTQEKARREAEAARAAERTPAEQGASGASAAEPEGVSPS